MNSFNQYESSTQNLIKSISKKIKKHEKDNKKQNDSLIEQKNIKILALKNKYRIVKKENRELEIIIAKQRVQIEPQLQFSENEDEMIQEIVQDKQMNQQIVIEDDQQIEELKQELQHAKNTISVQKDLIGAQQQEIDRLLKKESENELAVSLSDSFLVQTLNDKKSFNTLADNLSQFGEIITHIGTTTNMYLSGVFKSNWTKRMHLLRKYHCKLTNLLPTTLLKQEARMNDLNTNIESLTKQLNSLKVYIACDRYLPTAFIEDEELLSVWNEYENVNKTQLLKDMQSMIAECRIKESRFYFKLPPLVFEDYDAQLEYDNLEIQHWNTLKQTVADYIAIFQGWVNSCYRQKTELKKEMDLVNFDVIHEFQTLRNEEMMSVAQQNAALYQ